jgi:hypothetical protein
LGSLTSRDIAIVEAAQVKLAIKAAKATAKYKAKVAKGTKNIRAGRVFLQYINLTAEGYDIDNLPSTEIGEIDTTEESTEDEEEYKEVFILGQINIQLQTRVNQYFTAAEVEAEEAIQVVQNTRKIKENKVELG